MKDRIGGLKVIAEGLQKRDMYWEKPRIEIDRPEEVLFQHLSGLGNLQSYDWLVRNIRTDLPLDLEGRDYLNEISKIMQGWDDIADTHIAHYNSRQKSEIPSWIAHWSTMRDILKQKGVYSKRDASKFDKIFE